jgi:hypothetical protein
MSSADLLLNTLAWAAFVYFSLRMLRSYTQNYLQQRIAETETEIAEIQRRYREVKVEQHGDILYLFDAHNDQFIAQGQSAQDFLDRVCQDTVFRIVDGKPQVCERFKEMFASTQDT